MTVAALIIAFSSGAWTAIATVWFCQLSRLNPESPRLLIAIFAICWPVCELIAGDELTVFRGRKP